MKKIKAIFMMSAMAFFSVTTFNACTDACKDVVCNDGTCVDGTCDCDAGYEGTECETEERAKFVSSYNASGTVTCPNPLDNSSFSNVTLTVSNSSTTVTKVVISLGSALTVTGTISGTSVTIENQTISGLTYSGNGSLTGNVLTLNINEDLDGEVCVYAINASKQ